MMKRRMFEKISPTWLGIGISGTLLVILLVTESLLGRWDEVMIAGEFNAFANVTEGVLRDVRIAVVHCLQIGYLPAAFLYVLKNSRRTVLVLQEALHCTAEECEKLADSVKLSPRGLVAFGVIGLVLSFASPYLVPPAPVAPWNPSTWSPEVAWHRILGPLTQIWTWWLGYAVITVSVRMSRIAVRLNRIDLLDLSPLSPFTQLGLTNALLMIGSLSIWSLMSIEAGFGQIMLVIGCATMISTAIAMLLPVRGVHKRIHQSKETELSWVNGEIANHRGTLQTMDANHQSGKMADLIAYRGLVESVPEWPFTTSTYTRIFLYALLPVMSWGIGIVAEEIVGRTLF